MYTPVDRTWTNDSALPRLNRPSELPNAYGTMAPVRTIVLSVIVAASAWAVSTIVSVPCVMTMACSAARMHRATIAARPAASSSRLSIIIAVSTRTFTRQRPSRSISGTCVSRKKRRPVSSSYCLSNVPPVTTMSTDEFISLTRSPHHPRRHAPSQCCTLHSARSHLGTFSLRQTHLQSASPFCPVSQAGPRYAPPPACPVNYMRAHALESGHAAQKRDGIDVASLLHPRRHTHVGNSCDSHWRRRHLLRAPPFCPQAQRVDVPD